MKELTALASRTLIWPPPFEEFLDSFLNLGKHTVLHCSLSSADQVFFPFNLTIASLDEELGQTWPRILRFWPLPKMFYNDGDACVHFAGTSSSASWGTRSHSSLWGGTAGSYGPRGDCRRDWKFPSSLIILWGSLPCWSWAQMSGPSINHTAARLSELSCVFPAAKFASSSEYMNLVHKVDVLLEPSHRRDLGELRDVILDNFGGCRRPVLFS